MAVVLHHRNILVAGKVLLNQARLANAGFTGDEDDLTTALLCLSEGTIEKGEFVFAPDEGGLGIGGWRMADG